jgi:hypothetical protein
MEWIIKWSVVSDNNTAFGEARVSGTKVVDALNTFFRTKGNGTKMIMGIEAVLEKPIKEKRKKL